MGDVHEKERQRAYRREWEGRKQKTDGKLSGMLYAGVCGYHTAP